MLRNYLTIAIRNLTKRKLYSLINITGLSIGLAAVILILLFLQDELSYDKFHENAGDIYRIAWMSNDPQTRTPHPMAQALVRDFPEVQSAVSLSPLWGPGLTKQTFSVKSPEKSTWNDEINILGVDSTFFDVFTFNLVQGNRKSVLRNVGGMLISESMARKYFDDLDPIGKKLAINTDSLLVMVEGVFADVPDNSHFHFDFLVSYVTLKAFGDPESEYYTWADFGHFNYVRLTPGADPERLQDKLMNWIAGYVNWDERDFAQLANSNIFFALQPVTDIHLKSAIRWELEPNGNIEYVYIMSAAALFILLIACFNFMNLSTARSIERAGEVGVRKSLGAHKTQLLKQFLGESILLSFISIIIAGLLVEVILPQFNAFTNKDLALDVGNPLTILLLLISALAIGILAGLYPAFYLSGMNPVTILKGKFSSSGKGQFSRMALVTIQFTISTFLIAGSWTVINQLNFMQNRDLGFDKEEVIVMPIHSQEMRDRFEVLRTELLAVSGVKNVSAASNIPGKQFNQNPIHVKDDPNNEIDVSQSFVEYDVFNTLGIELLDGRLFDRNRPADFINTFIVNETAIIALDLKDPIGEVIILEADGELIEGEIIGVVKDFNFLSLHQPIKPLALQLIPAYNFVLVKLETQNFKQTISGLESVMKFVDERHNFEFDFLDDTLDGQYKNEDRMATVFASFAILAIIIACLGLGGLAAINFTFRKKEIGIKKVHGAPVRLLVYNLLKEYTYIVIVSIFVAAPFYWIILSNWLQNFTYRLPINPVVFIITGLLLLFISWLTLSYLTFHTIRANPINALRED